MFVCKQSIQDLETALKEALLLRTSQEAKVAKLTAEHALLQKKNFELQQENSNFILDINLLKGRSMDK